MSWGPAARQVSTVAIVRQMAKGQGGMRVLVEGVVRARAEFLQIERGHMTALIKAMPESSEPMLVPFDCATSEGGALFRELADATVSLLVTLAVSGGGAPVTITYKDPVETLSRTLSSGTVSSLEILARPQSTIAYRCSDSKGSGRLAVEHIGLAPATR